MGRFFSQDKPEFLDDNMFEMPYQLMGQVLMNKEKAVDDTIANSVSLYDKLTADVLSQDTPRANEVIQGYEKDIESIIDNIKNNPMEYGRYESNIRDLSRRINKDWTVGEISALQANKKSLMSYYADLDEKASKNPDEYTADYINAMKANAIRDYANGAMYDAQTQRATKNLDLQATTALPNLFDEFSKTADKMTADGYKIEQAYPGGPYIYKKGDKVEELTPDKLAEAFSSWVRGRTDYVGAVEQRKNLGLSDFAGADVNSIYGYDSSKNLVFANNYYGNNARAIANTFKYKKTEHEEDLKSNEWYMKQADWGREDKKNETEHVALTPTHAYTLGTQDAASLRTSLQTANIALNGSMKMLSDNAISLGLKPGTERYNAFASGDIQTMVEAGMPEETARQLSSQYKAHRTKKNFLNGQVDGFREYMKSKGKSTAGIGDTGWLGNKTFADEYNNYLSSAGELGKSKNFVENISTWNDIGLNDKTIKEAQQVFAQNFDQITFNIDQTYKGQYLQFEDPEDSSVVTAFIPQDSNIKDGTVETKGGKTITYVKAPDGKMSMQDLIRRGLVRTELKPIKETDEATGEETVTYQRQFTTRQNGKNVGVVLNEKTLGLVNALDDKGESNYSATMQIGDNRMDILVNTQDMKIPSVDNYISANYDELQFNRFMNQTNPVLLGRKDTKGPNGSVFRTERGKAFIIYNDGRRTEITDNKLKRQIYKINYFESN